MKYLKQFSSFLLFFISYSIFGQEIVVIDIISQFPLEGVAIYNKAKNISTITNKDGKADLSLFSEGDLINIQFIGFEKRTIKISSKELSSNFKLGLKPKDQSLEEVILSVARNPSKRKQIAEKVNIISSEDIITQRPSSGADLVGLSPGVRIQKSQGGGGSPVIRGFEANRILLVIDGIRLNNAIYRSGHLQNAITIHPNTIERVEVVFGSSSVGYGSDALGGVIHYYTRSPLINSEEKIKTQVSSDFSSANQAIINSISTELSFEKWASLTSINFSNFGDVKIGSNRRHGYPEWGLTPFYSLNSRNNYSSIPSVNENPLIQKNTGYNQIDFLQKFLIQLGLKSQLVLNFQYSNSSDISRYDKLIEENNGILRYAEWFYGPQKRFLFSPQLKVFPKKKFLNSGKIIFAFQNLKESRNFRSFNSLTRNTQREKVSALSLNSDFEFKLNEKHSFSYGFEGVYNEISSFAFKNDLILEQNLIIGLSPILPIPTRYPSNGSSYGTLAAYTNWIWDYSQKLTINAGLRITNTFLRGKWKEYNNVNALLSSVDLKNEALTGTLAITYRPTKKTQFNVILSNGFRSPNIDDVGKIRENKGQLIVPNPMLYPEYAYNFELGLTKYFKKPNNYFSIRGYSTLISRHIGRDFYTIFADKTTPNEKTIIYGGQEVITFSNNNLGDRYILGTSFDGNINFTKNISLKGNINIIEALKNEQYGPLPSISPIFGNSELTFKKESWFASLRYQFSGKKNPEDYSLGGEDGLDETPVISYAENIYAGTPKWSELSLLAQYQWSKKIYVRFGIDNIFDIHYKNFGSGISSPGRNFKFGINIQL